MAAANLEGYAENVYKQHFYIQQQADLRFDLE